MITIRHAEDRGRTRIGWLDGRHTFSFGNYFDPDHVSFGHLRVINDDRVTPGAGFPTHPHADMEIVTYVIEGALEHKDSTGGGGVIRPGDVQRMSAGSGVTHSEFNHSKTEPVRLLQVWLFPEVKGIEPGYDQKSFADDRRNKLRLVASKGAKGGSLDIHQDADIYNSILDAGKTLTHDLAPGRQAWLQVARGSLTLNGGPLGEGDGAAITDETRLEIGATAEAEFLLFDMGS
jgi:redox-sensitive bicupin YhaK (pirin superfamily)